jgi:DnaK suppressor protein
VNTDQYKRRLQIQEQELSTRLKRTGASAREPVDEPVGDVSDVSVGAELKEMQLTDAAADSRVLTQVREALMRIDNGTFGTCVVDGRPIEEKRLEAVPWTPYCLKHQQELEGSSPPRTFTL